MKDFIIKPDQLRRIELWAATTIFVFVVFFLVTNLVSTPEWQFNKAKMPFDYYDNYFYPQLVRYILMFGAFLLLNFKVVPALMEGQRQWLSILILAAVFGLTGIILGITDTHIRQYLFPKYNDEQTFYNAMFQGAYVKTLWILILFGLYTVIKHASIFLLSNAGAISTKYRMVTRDSLIAFVLWMISLFILLVGGIEEEILVCWIILIPFAISYYCLSSYTLLPAAFRKGKPFRIYLLQTVGILLLSYLPIAFLLMLFTHNEGLAFGFSFFNAAFQLLFTAPLSWLMFKRRQQGNEEIFVLKKELGRSNAKLDFLRSQINPHFLFNALNTIYATAINEKAERTGEAIEKLGDMMRFMLHENVQDKISLARETEYLDNYIGLQKLRTEHNPALRIDTQIDQNVELLSIAPMLLIPFVENAFKHGISFREASHIRVAMEVKEKTLYFDVYNTKHDKQGNDPERNKSGIGLNNVRQRLQMLYPGKHELVIRETGKEFFIHLTVQLS
ncbi:MAG TPA: histidine kinase [Sphingobacteriaceae bacterium]